MSGERTLRQYIAEANQGIHAAVEDMGRHLDTSSVHRGSNDMSLYGTRFHKDTSVRPEIPMITGLVAAGFFLELIGGNGTGKTLVTDALAGTRGTFTMPRAEVKPADMEGYERLSDGRPTNGSLMSQFDGSYQVPVLGIHEWAQGDPRSRTLLSPLMPGILAQAGGGVVVNGHPLFANQTSLLVNSNYASERGGRNTLDSADVVSRKAARVSSEVELSNTRAFPRRVKEGAPEVGIMETTAASYRRSLFGSIIVLTQPDSVERLAAEVAPRAAEIFNQTVTGLHDQGAEGLALYKASDRDLATHHQMAAVHSIVDRDKRRLGVEGVESAEGITAESFAAVCSLAMPQYVSIGEDAVSDVRSFVDQEEGMAELLLSVSAANAGYLAMKQIEREVGRGGVLLHSDTTQERFIMDHAYTSAGLDADREAIDLANGALKAQKSSSGRRKRWTRRR